MVLVISANGNVGQRIIPQLIEKGLKVAAMDINPAVEELKEYGVTKTIVADMAKEEDMQRALVGCDQVLFISPMHSEDVPAWGKNVIDQSVKSGFRQFVFMSGTHPQMSTLLQHTQKLKIETYLIYKGLSNNLNYTILQPMHYIPPIRTEGIAPNQFAVIPDSNSPS